MFNFQEPCLGDFTAPSYRLWPLPGPRRGLEPGDLRHWHVLGYRLGLEIGQWLELSPGGVDMGSK